MNGNFTATVRGRGPGLLLAHGAGGSVDANFGPVLDDLARTHTLVVSTTADRLTGPPLSRELADGIPHADLVEVDAGHLIGDEAPGAWLAAIQRFLSGKKATA